MKTVYKTQLTLFSSYFDKNDNLTPKSILSIFQDVASIHAEQLNIGYKPMLDKNLFWVISRIKYDVIKMPKPYQQVIIKTWPHQKGKIDFDRDLQILDLNNNVLIKATSKWCVIDVNTRRLMRTDGIEYDGEILEEKNYQDKFSKIDLPLDDFKKCLDYKVMFSDLDHNKHMNNTNYANLILSALDNKVVNHFEINFVAECKQDDIISVYHSTQNQEEFTYGKVNDNIVYISKTY